MIEKKLGKISNVSFGYGGYQECCLGINFSFIGPDGDRWGVCDSKTFWDVHKIECTKDCKWTEADRSQGFDNIMRYVSDLLHDAKVDDVSKLKGKPVEVTFDGNYLKSWRILKEVL